MASETQIIRGGPIDSPATIGLPDNIFESRHTPGSDTILFTPCSDEGHFPNLGPIEDSIDLMGRRRVQLQSAQ